MIGNSQIIIQSIPNSLDSSSSPRFALAFHWPHVTSRVAPSCQSLTRRDAIRLIVDLSVPTNPVPSDCTAASTNTGYLKEVGNEWKEKEKKRGGCCYIP